MIDLGNVDPMLFMQLAVDQQLEVIEQLTFMPGPSA